MIHFAKPKKQKAKEVEAVKEFADFKKLAKKPIAEVEKRSMLTREMPR